MDKRRKLIISIVMVILLVVIVGAVTYAYIVAITNSGDVNNSSGMLDINYDAPADITGSFIPSTDRSGGLFTTTKASLVAGSQVAYLNMYVTPTALTNLNISALKWETEGLRDINDDGTLDVVCYKSGNFSTALVDEPIKVVDACQLDYDDTTFNIYIWLDASLLNTSLSGATFGAKIGADSVDITGTY